MALDQYGNPIFGSPLTALTPLALPTATAPSSGLADLVSSIGSSPAEATDEEDAGSGTLALLLGALGNRASTVSTGGAVSGGGGKGDWIQQIRQLSKKYGLDPHAVLAVVSVEGLSGGVGDNNTSFGPFQLHRGGALPAGKDKAWAESPAGLEYAVRKIASVAKGLRGEAAIRAIVTKFERPADPSGEIKKARSRYGKVR
jgi:hypothetical protein